MLKRIIIILFECDLDITTQWIYILYFCKSICLIHSTCSTCLSCSWDGNKPSVGQWYRIGSQSMQDIDEFNSLCWIITKDRVRKNKNMKRLTQAKKAFYQKKNVYSYNPGLQVRKRFLKLWIIDNYIKSWQTNLRDVMVM